MIRLDVKPMGAPRMVHSDRWAHRDVVERYHAYCDELRLRLPGYVLPDELVIDFIIEMPKSWSQKKQRALLSMPHQQRPDCDNLCKAFMDAFKSEDSHVWSLRATKTWGGESCILLGGHL